MKNILLVARRELQAGLMKRSFMVVTVIIVAVIVVGIFVLAHFVNDDSAQTDSEQVTFTEETASLIPAVEHVADAHGLALDPLVLADADEGESAVSEGEAIAFVHGTPPDITVTFKSAPHLTFVEVLTQALQDQAMVEQVTALGGDPAQFAQGLAAAVPSVVLMDGDVDEFGPEYFMAMVTLSLLLFGLIMSGTIISTGVVEEKSSRIVEILLATIRPTQLFAGKVLGAGLIGLIQLAIYGAAIFVAAQLSGVFDGFDIPVGTSLLSMLGWFIVGFAAMGTLWGGLASLVSRQEDVGVVTSPIVFLLMVPFYLSFFLVPNAPESSWTTGLSIAPFFAPFMMPVRQVFVDVPGWQLALAVGLNLSVIPVVVWIAGTIYKRSILHTGSRMNLREVFAKQA